MIQLCTVTLGANEPHSALAWNAFMMDRDNLYFIASGNDDHVEGYCDKLAHIMRFLGNQENWNREIRQVFGH